MLRSSSTCSLDALPSSKFISTSEASCPSLRSFTLLPMKEQLLSPIKTTKQPCSSDWFLRFRHHEGELLVPSPPESSLELWRWSF
uniref:Uncharacterized protein n=1 Tax=Kalanchoe fedtschenkoi TaxID=63787 RepID=A0A7N0TD89_KALFE